MKKVNEEIQIANYWEHHKFAKDLALIYPLNHHKRLKVEKTLSEMQSKIK